MKNSNFNEKNVEGGYKTVLCPEWKSEIGFRIIWTMDILITKVLLLNFVLLIFKSTFSFLLHTDAS